MKHEELRQSNWMYCIDKKEEVQILYMGILQFADNQFNHKKQNYEPILINENWLKKLGWKSVGKLHTTYKFKNYLIEAPMLEWKNNWGFRQIMNKDESVWLKDISFVHELQNLYYALRSAELVLAVTPKRKN